jgi:soluble lytic murein transglycosylase-like protein
LQLVRWLVLSAVVLVGASIQLHQLPRALGSLPAAEIRTTGPSQTRTDFLTPGQLTGAERLAGAQVEVPAILAPIPTQRPKSVPKPSGEIPLLIWNTFAPLGPDAQAWALRVAYCESRYHPNSVNSRSGAAGLFQFMPSTWAASPYASQSPFDPVANTNAALWLYKRSGPGRWSCK